MSDNQTKRKLKIGLGIYLNIGLAVVLACAAIYLINVVKIQGQEQALLEAETKAQLILERNLAIHAYFSHTIKPKVFELTEPVRSEDYFEPAWMSSTFAVREIDKEYKLLSNEEYYYKECAINARSPENEADGFEKAFIEELNTNPDLKYRSLIRNLNGSYYYVTLRRGEIMEDACLRCHSTPNMSPKKLVDIYGPERSFNRSVNEVVSAISIRVPLSAAYASTEQFSKRLSKIFIITLLLIFATQYFMHRFFILGPINRLKNSALNISKNEKLLGEEISSSVSHEFEELSSAFNSMSLKLRNQMDHLEEMVEKLRSSNEKLKKAHDDVKTLQGILPICSFCKNIRNDQGYYEQIEGYIHKHSDVDFSHTICPSCMEKHYPKEYKKIISKKKS